MFMSRKIVIFKQKFKLFWQFWENWGILPLEFLYVMFILFEISKYFGAIISCFPCALQGLNANTDSTATYMQLGMMEKHVQYLIREKCIASHCVRKVDGWHVFYLRDSLCQKVDLRAIWWCFPRPCACCAASLRLNVRPREVFECVMAQPQAGKLDYYALLTPAQPT